MKLFRYMGGLATHSCILSMGDLSLGYGGAATLGRPKLFRILVCAWGLEFPESLTPDWTLSLKLSSPPGTLNRNFL